MTKKCIGCGSLLQTLDNTKEGYINRKVFEKAEYCERCFKITHYGETHVIEKTKEAKIYIEEINKCNKPVLYIMDALTISENILKPLSLIKNKVYLVLTKKDLLPKSVKDYKLINYISELTLIKDVFVVSAEKLHGINELYNKLVKDKVSSIYVIGHTNAGKSTLINSLLKLVGKSPSITVSSLPNTTIEEINIELDNNLTIIDTPGFVNENSISNFIDLKEYKSLIPKKEIKPKIHTLKPEFMILVDGILRIENNTNENANLIFYIKNEIPFDKMRSIRNDRLKKLEKISLSVKEGEDIIIEGLGFIKVTKDAVLDMYVINKNIISKRNKMI